HTRFSRDWSSDVCSSDLGDGRCLSCRNGQPRGDRPPARPRRARGRTGGTRAAARRGEPQSAPAAGAVVRRAGATAGQERAGALPRRGDDRAAEVAGAAHMSSASEPGSIRLLDREYPVGVEPSARDSLMAAAKLLEEKMREVRGANRIAAVDRVAVLAALNLAHELQQLRDGQAQRDRELTGALDRLQQRLDGLAL